MSCWKCATRDEGAAGWVVCKGWIGFTGHDANLYGYCGNSPTNATDPSGLFPLGIPSWGDYWRYLTHPQDEDKWCQYGQIGALGVSALAGGAAAGLAIAGTEGGLAAAAGAVRATAHGAMQLAARGWTQAEIAAALAAQRIMTQADGAKVFIQEVSPGKFNVIVQGANGIITALKNIDQQALNNLARNYGWH